MFEPGFRDELMTKQSQIRYGCASLGIGKDKEVIEEGTKEKESKINGSEVVIHKRKRDRVEVNSDV